MDILFPIETASRELLYKVYLCNILSNKGFNCYLGTKKEVYYLIDKFENFIYFDKGYHQGKSDIIYKKIKKNNGLIFSLDEEGAIDFPDSSTLKNRYSKALTENSDKIFLWGEFQKSLIDNKSISKKIKITGHPRFHMLKKKFRLLYKEEVNRIKNKFGDFILINTNLGFGNNIIGDKNVKDRYSNRFENINNIINYDKIKMQSIVDLILKLPNSQKIVLRPHPEESLDYYNKNLGHLNNLTITYEGSVVPWLISCNMLIHQDCTTSIEYLMLGRKSVSYLPKEKKYNILTELPLKISHRIDKIEDIISFILERKNHTDYSCDKELKIIEKYFSFSLDSLKEISEESQKNAILYSNNKLKIKDRCFLKLMSIRRKLRNMIIKDEVKLSMKKLKGFNNKNITYFNSKTNEIEDSKVNLIPISSNLYLFKK